MTSPVERLRELVGQRVVRTTTLEELGERVEELAVAARENAALAEGLERHLDALEAEVLEVARRGTREG